MLDQKAMSKRGFELLTVEPRVHFRGSLSVGWTACSAAADICIASKTCRHVPKKIRLLCHECLHPIEVFNVLVMDIVKKDQVYSRNLNLVL